MEINQYQVVIARLDPTVGSELKKTRPCVAISPNELNRVLRTVVIAPFTSNLNDYPTRIKVIFQGRESRIAIDQIRTVDKQRILSVAGNLSYGEVRNIKSVIHRTFVF